MLSVIKLSVVMLRVIMLSVTAPFSIVAASLASAERKKKQNKNLIAFNVCLRIFTNFYFYFFIVIKKGVKT